MWVKSVVVFLFSVFPALAQDAPLMVVDYEYQHPTKAFKMQVPSDWNVKENFSGYALFMEPKLKKQASAEEPLVADPNISVAVVNMPIPIDEESLETYGQEIEKKFRETNGAGNEFQIFSKHLMTDLPGGKRGLLYYISYKNNGIDVGSTILVMSNAENIYRTTYTDYKFSYDKNFEKFFPVMASMQIQGSPPERQNVFYLALPWILGIGAIFGVFWALRRAQAQKMRRLYDEIVD